MLMNFSEALESLKQGNKIQRVGWNGKGMYLMYYSPISNGTIDFPVEGEMFVLQPFILMKTADETVVPWLASQSDLLQDDWQIVNDVHIL